MFLKTFFKQYKKKQTLYFCQVHPISTVLCFSTSFLPNIHCNRRENPTDSAKFQWLFSQSGCVPRDFHWSACLQLALNRTTTTKIVAWWASRRQTRFLKKATSRKLTNSKASNHTNEETTVKSKTGTTKCLITNFESRCFAIFKIFSKIITGSFFHQHVTYVDKTFQKSNNGKRIHFAACENKAFLNE